MPPKIRNSKFEIRNSRGLFVTFEGIEGCGKTTQAGMLALWFRRQGHKVVVTREPGGPHIAENIRRILLDARHHAMHPMTELLLLEAARAQHVAEVIAPALKSGAIVICDRFADSSTAYQGFGRKIDRAMVEELNRIATGGTWPDLTLVIDVPVDEGLKRATKRKRRFDRMESQEKQFHLRVRNGFKALAKSEPARVKLLDGTFPPDVIQAAVRQLVLNKLIKTRNPKQYQISKHEFTLKSPLMSFSRFVTH
ncbi:MAG: dTMP kinase [Candidatus Edwardsbacteria bacterium]|nr:dTMP kinase [Candidatus Edwardsbacteria bacterium]